MATDPGQVPFGHEVKVEINSTEFGHTGGSIRFVGDVSDCGDSTNGDKKAPRVGLKACEINLKALKHKDVNIHNAPLELSIGGSIAEIKVYHGGADMDPYILYDVEIATVTPNFERGNPASFDFVGHAHDWDYPTDS